MEAPAPHPSQGRDPPGRPQPHGPWTPQLLLHLLLQLACLLQLLAPSYAQSCHTNTFNDTQNPHRCVKMRHVCVDQHSFISFDPAFRNDLGFSAPIPHLVQPKWLVYNLPDAHGIGDKYVGGQMAQWADKPYFRPATDLEEHWDLLSPQFSTCTTPIVITHSYPFNAAETFRMAVDVLYNLQVIKGWLTPNATLVLSYPPGTAMPGFTRFWFQAFSRYQPTTLSQFSARMPPGTPSNSTAEGLHHRCFEQLYHCSIVSESHYGRRWYEAAQHINTYYKRTMADRHDRVRKILHQRLPQASAIMKVVFGARSAATTRRLLNEEELIHRCNRGEVKLPPGSMWTGMHCFRHDFGRDMLLDTWLMRHVDVVFGVHGALLINGMFMKEGGAIVEVRPYQFYGGWPNIYFRRFASNNLERPWKVHWYAVDTFNRSNSKPGLFEVVKRASFSFGGFSRDRHVRVPWEVFEYHAKNIALVGRDTAKYLALRFGRLHHVRDNLRPAESSVADFDLMAWSGDTGARINEGLGIWNLAGTGLA